MERTRTTSQHLAGVGTTRAHAHACSYAITRGSWSIVMPFLGVNTAPKPGPRRHLRIS